MVRYILKQDVPSSLEDALKVAEAYMLPKDEIYSLRIIDLIDREKVSKTKTWFFKKINKIEGLPWWRSG